MWDKKKSISGARAKLHISQMTVHRILLENLDVYSYKSQAVQILTAHNIQP
jgi:hypothetical protein